MKKLLFISIVSAFILGFPSCEKVSTGFDSADIVGTWRYVHFYQLVKNDGEVVSEKDEDTDGDGLSQTFNKDGTGDLGASYRTITWSMSGEELAYGGLVYTIEKLTHSELIVSNWGSHTIEDGVIEDFYNRYSFIKEE